MPHHGGTGSLSASAAATCHVKLAATLRKRFRLHTSRDAAAVRRSTGIKAGRLNHPDINIVSVQVLLDLSTSARILVSDSLRTPKRQ
jgi:hypothetical protein